MTKFQSVLAVITKEGSLVLVRRVGIDGGVYGLFSVDVPEKSSRCPDKFVAELPSGLATGRVPIQVFDAMEWENQETQTTIHFLIWVLRLPPEKSVVQILGRRSRGNEPRLSWVSRSTELDPKRFLPGHWDVINHVLK